MCVCVGTICLVKGDVHIMLKCHCNMKCCKSRCGYVESESTMEPRILIGEKAVGMWRLQALPVQLVKNTD